jgi:hypothetical protein
MKKAAAMSSSTTSCAESETTVRVLATVATFGNCGDLSILPAIRLWQSLL